MTESIILIVEDESSGAPSHSYVVGYRIGSNKAQYDLYFTDRRIIAATVFSQSDISEFSAAAAYQSLFTWKKTRQENRESFKQRTPDEILNMHKDSFELPYQKIRSVIIKKGLANAKIIAEFEFLGRIENVNLKIPKKRTDEVRQLLQTKIPGGVR